MAGWEDVRAIALALPEVEESRTHGKLAFKVRRKLFAWESPHEHGKLVVKVDPDERALLVVRTRPGTSSRRTTRATRCC